MFKKAPIVLGLLILTLSLAGCFTSSIHDGGLDPVESLNLDRDYESDISVEQGDVFALDVETPSDKGYNLTSAFFDPLMLRMERYVEYQDEHDRARYLFTAEDTGICEILIKMKPEEGGDETVYRKVNVTITAPGGGWFD